MKLLSSKSHNIAWFKLAEFVARGEKERALSVHKLLMHSVADQAFAFQLEGDILLAFDDIQALVRYHQAADMYKQQKDYQKAIAIYERVDSLKKDRKNLEHLLHLYCIIGDDAGMVHSFSRLVQHCLHEKTIEHAIDVLHAYSFVSSDDLQVQLRSTLFFGILVHDATSAMLVTLLHQILELYVASMCSQTLTQFMAKLEVVDSKMHAMAQDWLCNAQS